MGWEGERTVRGRARGMGVRRSSPFLNVTRLKVNLLLFKKGIGVTRWGNRILSGLSPIDLPEKKKKKTETETKQKQTNKNTKITR